jgi:hypothetical protein
VGIHIKDIDDPALRRKIIEQDARQNAKQLTKHAPDPLRPLETGMPERSQRPALERPRPQREKRKGRVAVVVSLITCCQRAADDDNDAHSKKPIRDAIAESLGLDDGDSRIHWEHGQCETRGPEGVIVKIESL